MKPSSACTVSLGDDGATVLVAQAAQGDTFTLGWGADPGCLLFWGGGGFSLSNDRSPLDDAAGSAGAEFTVDFVDGCWFALNLPDRSQVVDIYEARSEDRTPVILYPWHGGANQIWRAEAV